MSHELRTPLNAIIGFSDAINAEIFGPMENQKYASYVDDIHASGQHLLALINDLLDVSAIEAGKINLIEEEISIASIVETSLQFVRPLADNGSISLETDMATDLPLLKADRRRVTQVLINLLSNAVKFTNAGGTVTTTARIEDGKELNLSVTDTGIGMDESELAKAMTKFGQIETALTNKNEGTGLGLPLTKGLVELHQGHFTIESEKGKGTMVRVTFPNHRLVA
jgi:signal transduction histidine kinase